MPTSSAFNRWVLDVLVLFNVVAQGLLALVLLLGQAGHAVLPVTGAAVITLFLLMFFYARWLIPVLDRRQIATILFIKELGLFVLFGIVVGLVILFRWLFG